MFALFEREKFGSLHMPGASSSSTGTSGKASRHASEAFADGGGCFSAMLLPSFRASVQGRLFFLISRCEGGGRTRRAWIFAVPLARRGDLEALGGVRGKERASGSYVRGGGRGNASEGKKAKRKRSEKQLLSRCFPFEVQGLEATSPFFLFLSFGSFREKEREEVTRLFLARGASNERERETT